MASRAGVLAVSSKGMVTSPHATATEAGLQVLREGGNAVEAALATAICLAVSYPHFTGLGGDAFMILCDAQGQVSTLSGIGQAASLCPPNDGHPLPVRGPGSMLTSAATVDTWGQAWDISRKELGGRKSWAQLLAPAQTLAEDGFPLSPSQRFWIEFRQDEMAQLPGVRRRYSDDGRPPPPGWRLRQPALAHSLALLARNGPRDFYEGELARALAQGLQQAGSPLSAADLAATRARREAPLRLAYRGGELLAHQPPTQGMTTLQIMGVLDAFDLGKIAHGSADYYHLLVEAVKRAFLDRNRYLADPDHAPLPLAALLSADHLQRLADSIDPRRALPWPHAWQHGDTVCIAAADAHGNAVSMLQTLYYDWGSGVEVGDTGILWHNRGAAFSTKPDSPNCLAGGKRPFHTLNPGIYLKEGKPRLLYGTQGADGQPQTLAAVLTRLIDYEMDPLSALASPRFLLGQTFSDPRHSLKLEQDAGAAVFTQLQQRGHELSPIPAQSPLAGHPGVIAIDAEGRFSGAHDPRSDGVAMGV